MNNMEQSALRPILAGLILGFGLPLLTIMFSGGLGGYFDIPSLLIVVGGSIGGTLVTYPVSELTQSFRDLRTALRTGPTAAHDRLARLLEYARIARKSGVLSLEEIVKREFDPFLRRGLELAVDGVGADEIRRTLSIELTLRGDRYRRAAKIFQSMGQIAPAMGLIGTLIGLVQMLRFLNDSASIGPNMAIALLTTFYGAMLANLLFLPLAAKLYSRSDEENHLKEMTIEGIIAIAEGSNPMLVEQKLGSFVDSRSAG